MFETQEVRKTYSTGTASEVRAVDGVSWEIPEGTFALLKGRSGSGKSTLLALMGALIRPTSGHITFQGRSVSDLSDSELARVRRELGFVFQDFALMRRLTVWENVAYPLIPLGIPRVKRRSVARDLLERVGLSAKWDERPENLSGGEQQRVAIARALVNRPKALLADEPTSNLDRESAEQIAQLLKSLHASGMTVVASSHDPVLWPLATQTVELDQGRIQSIAGTRSNS